MTLVEFLRARLDEDEAVALAACKGPHRSGRWTPGLTTGDILDAEDRYPLMQAEDGPNADEVEHIVRWDPARVLAEVAARRQIIAICEPRLVDASTPYRRQYIPGDAPPFGEPVLRAMAAPDADHPDFDPAWRG